jgi:hypothetical protein
MALFTRQYIKKGAKETSKAKRSEAGQKRSKAEHKGLPLQTPAAAAAVSWVCGTQLFSSCVSMCACCCRWKWLCFLELIRPKPSRPTSFTHASKSPPNPNGRGDSGRRVVGVRCAALFLVCEHVRVLLPMEMVVLSRAYSAEAEPPDLTHTRKQEFA